MTLLTKPEAVWLVLMLLLWGALGYFAVGAVAGFAPALTRIVFVGWRP